MIKERPILFSTPMVKAIIRGWKTQTRRTIKPLRNMSREERHNWRFNSLHVHTDGNLYAIYNSDDDQFLIKCPYGKPGDRLWVRESFAIAASGEVYYKESCEQGELSVEEFREPNLKWKPSIHMPRNISRITLEIVEVYPDFLRAMSDRDMVQEGISIVPTVPRAEDHRPPFGQLWDKINGEGEWDLNPDVWVVKFKVLENA